MKKLLKNKSLEEILELIDVGSVLKFKNELVTRIIIVTSKPIKNFNFGNEQIIFNCFGYRKLNTNKRIDRYNFEECAICDFNKIWWSIICQ